MASGVTFTRFLFHSIPLCSCPFFICLSAFEIFFPRSGFFFCLPISINFPLILSLSALSATTRMTVFQGLVEAGKCTEPTYDQCHGWSLVAFGRSLTVEELVHFPTSAKGNEKMVVQPEWTKLLSVPPARAATQPEQKDPPKQPAKDKGKRDRKQTEHFQFEAKAECIKKVAPSVGGITTTTPVVETADKPLPQGYYRSLQEKMGVGYLLVDTHQNRSWSDQGLGSDGLLLPAHAVNGAIADSANIGSTIAIFELKGSATGKDKQGGGSGQGKQKSQSENAAAKPLRSADTLSQLVLYNMLILKVQSWRQQCFALATNNHFMLLLRSTKEHAVRSGNVDALSSVHEYLVLSCDSVEARQVLTAFLTAPLETFGYSMPQIPISGAKPVSASGYLGCGSHCEAFFATIEGQDVVAKKFAEDVSLRQERRALEMLAAATRVQGAGLVPTLFNAAGGERDEERGGERDEERDGDGEGGGKPRRREDATGTDVGEAPKWLLVQPVGKSFRTFLHYRQCCLTKAHVVQLVKILQGAHNCELVHRDVCWRNIFCVGDNVLLNDWGSAVPLGSSGTYSGACLEEASPWYANNWEKRAALSAARSDDLHSFARTVARHLTDIPQKLRGSSPQSVVLFWNKVAEGSVWGKIFAAADRVDSSDVRTRETAYTNFAALLGDFVESTLLHLEVEEGEAM